MSGLGLGLFCFSFCLFVCLWIFFSFHVSLFFEDILYVVKHLKDIRDVGKCKRQQTMLSL